MESLHLTNKVTNNALQSRILTLPNELLGQIFSYLPSLQLGQLCTICRRIHSVIIHILNWRIHHKLNVHNYRFYLSTFSVEKQSCQAVLQCIYLGKWRLDKPRQPHGDQQVAIDSDNIEVEGEPQHISNLDTSNIGSLYCHFLLTQRNTSSNSIEAELPTELVSTWFSLNDEEPFKNLWIQPVLHKRGGKRPPNLPTEVFDKKEVLVKREWLQNAEKATSRYFSAEDIEMCDTNLNEKSDSTCSSTILWLNGRNLAGVKLRVRERKPRDGEARYGKPGTDYELYYEALLIRTVHLLVTLEHR